MMSYTINELILKNSSFKSEFIKSEKLLFRK